MTDKNIIPIDALFGEGTEPNLSFDPRQALRHAEVIIGVDEKSQHKYVVFGRDLIERIIEQGRDEIVATIRVGLDQETGELEKLVALIKAVKGYHDYRSGPSD